MDSLRNNLRKLRWRLTLSYSAVTVGPLLVVGLTLWTTLLSRVMILNFRLAPEKWIEVANQRAVPIMHHILS